MQIFVCVHDICESRCGNICRQEYNTCVCVRVHLCSRLCLWKSSKPWEKLDMFKVIMWKDDQAMRNVNWLVENEELLIVHGSGYKCERAFMCMCVYVKRDVGDTYSLFS